MFKDIKQVMKDSVLYGIGNVAVKLVGFILIPLYTDAEYFSTADYGLMGLLEVTSQILIAVMGLSLYSGLIRWYWDAEFRDKQKSVFFTTLLFTILTSLGVGGLLWLNVDGLSTLLIQQEGYSIGEELPYILQLLILTSMLEENVSNIGNISIFDPVLFDRFVKGIKKVEGENKKLGNRLNTSVMKSLSACFATCVKEKDEKALEGILGVKAGLGNLENGMSAMMGGGKSYLPAEQLRLDFYSNNRLDDKFKTLMSEYMIAQQQENSIDSLRKTEEITNRHFEMLIDSARMKNDSAAIVSIRKTMGMASLFGGVKYKLLSSFVISATRHYWKITDQQNVGEKKKCIAWVNYAYQLDRTPATAWGCADLLEEIGEKQGAKKLLNDVLEVIKNNSLSDADPKDIQSVTERVEKM